MHSLTSKRVVKFARDFGFEGSQAELFERYVAATYLYTYLNDKASLIDASVLGGGNDEGIDVGAVIVNGQLVFEPDEIDALVADQEMSSVRVIFIQAKTSESFDSKLIAKFLHGVESVTKHALNSRDIRLSPRLVDLANLIDRVAENLDKFQDTKIPCELYYVTTSSNDASAAVRELQVSMAMSRINDLDVYSSDLRLRPQGHAELAAKQKERHGPQNVQFNFEKRQTIPSTADVNEAYIGLVSAKEILRLLRDDNNNPRPGIFEDNVRLDLGPKNPVNRRILQTLESSQRTQFPLLNNGLTIIATKLQGAGDRFFVSGYQVVNGGQTSHQLMRWAESEAVTSSPDVLASVWIPVKIVSSSDPEVRSRVAVATNLQSGIGNVDIQASTQIAKDVEELFEQSGPEGLRYERQNRGKPLAFARTRVVGTAEINRAVAATVFGESSRAIASPKDLEAEGSFIWGGYPVEMYYYSAWILYRIDRYFARTPDRVTLKAAKYHIAMMVSAVVNPKIVSLFERVDNQGSEQSVKKLRVFEPARDGRVLSKQIEKQIEDAIPLAAEICSSTFQDVLRTGRSLRKDDVRSRRHQEELLKKVKESRQSVET